MLADSKIEWMGSKGNKVFFHGLDSLPDVDSLLNTMFYLLMRLVLLIEIDNQNQFNKRLYNILSTNNN